MKKLWIGLTALVVAMGIGTAYSYAASTGDNNADNGKVKNFFQQMLPQMKQMHPNLTDEQIKQMYDNCRSGGGTGRSMMNNSSGRGGMMNF